jgi:hypothetical protein
LKDLYAANTSVASRLGVFDRVHGHEPPNAPGRGYTCSFTLTRIRPARTASGLNVTSALVVFLARIQTPGFADPMDAIDPDLGTTGWRLMDGYHADLDLGGTIQTVDVMGREGVLLEGQYGYIEQDRKQFRLFDVTVPMIVNDVWDQVM